MSKKETGTEEQIAELKEENAHLSQQLASKTRMVEGYIKERVEFSGQLYRYGLAFGSGKIISVHHPMPIASGLTLDPPKPYSNELKPVICWYRLVPDQKIKGQINEEYSHYEEAKVDDAPSKSGRPKKAKKNQPLKVIPPLEGAVPTPRGGTIFTGKWTWKLKYRTNELTPKILEEKKK